MTAQESLPLRSEFRQKAVLAAELWQACPQKIGIGVFSPALDKKENSIAGIKALEMLSQKTNLSIF